LGHGRAALASIDGATDSGLDHLEVACQNRER